MTDQPASGEMFDIVSVKGFGDLVIALACLRWVRQDAHARIRLLLGQHLQPLFDVLNAPFPATTLSHADAGPAALFQLRSRSPFATARSALTLRRALRQADEGRWTVFDEMDVRHRFLTAGRLSLALPRRDNLYRAWHAFLCEQDLAAEIPANIARVPGRRLHIFPGAREQERRFPVELLYMLVDKAVRAGWDTRIIAVAGEMPHLVTENLPVEEIPRDFARTLAAVSQADHIVSADSMTAHLAEYCDVPVYVCWPKEKHFWLPLSAFRRHRHALFKEVAGSASLSTFLDAAIVVDNAQANIHGDI